VTHRRKTRHSLSRDEPRLGEFLEREMQHEHLIGPVPHFVTAQKSSLSETTWRAWKVREHSRFKVIDMRDTEWFWYGYDDGESGEWFPPDGLLPKLFYWLGHVVGRRHREH
jgi:hypothetical protein